MKLASTLTIASLLVASTASTAFAGETINRVTTGWSKFNTDTKVKIESVDQKTYDNWTRNVKLDFVGENAGVNLKYKDGKIDARGFANNIDNPDPFANVGEVYTSEYGKLTTTTSIHQKTHEYGKEDFIEYSLITDTGY